jgi:hypothetical protein
MGPPAVPDGRVSVAVVPVPAAVAVPLAMTRRRSVRASRIGAYVIGS